MLKKYIAASSINVVSSVLVKAIAFLQVAVLTRITTTEEFGEFSLFLSYVNILTLVIGGSVSSSFGIAKQDFKEEYKAYISSMVGFSYLLLSIAFLVYFVIFTVDWTLFGLFVIIHSFSLNILTNYDIKKIFDFAYVKAAIVAFASAILGFVGVVSAVEFVNSADKGIVTIIAITISTCIMSFFCQYSMWHPGKKLFGVKYWKYAVVNSFLMIPHNLSLVILNQMDRIMIGELLNNTFVAIYSAVYSLSVVISILWTAIKKVWLNWVYEKLNVGDFVFVRNVNIIILNSATL